MPETYKAESSVLYDPSSVSKSWEQVLQSFSQVFRIPASGLSSELKAKIREVFDQRFPDLDQSAATRLFLGTIPGVVPPQAQYPVSWLRNIRAALLLLDVIETIAIEADAKYEEVVLSERGGKKGDKLGKGKAGSRNRRKK